MKKILLLMALAITAMSLQAAPVNPTAASKVAKNYLANELYAGRIMAPAATTPVLVKTEYGTDKKLNLPVYYIYNTSTTFLVVAGDDRAEEILMVGDQPLDMDLIPDGLQYLLDCYKEQIDFLHANPRIVVERPSHQRDQLRAVTYGPLLTATWDQGTPYNNLCKFTYNNRTYTCYTGCPATSAAMVMYFWKYPTAQIPAIASYTSTLDIGTYQSNEVTYTYPALDAVTFDWGNMKNSYTGSYNSTQGNAVATLMRYIGQAEKMMYGVNGSGIYTNETQKVVDMFKNWGYMSTCAVKYKTSYTEANWKNLLIAELAAGRPMIYNGVDNSEGGHAFNVDGYRDSDDKYHVNFGWSGSGNSWYAMNAFSYSGATFSSNQQAVIGIQPPGGQVTTPVLSVNPTSLAFESTPGETVTKTFTVSGTNLYGDVTISKSGNSTFTVSPTTLTAAQAMAGATVTVTYYSSVAGNHTGTITVASSGAESQTVSLTGTAASAGPVVNTSVSSLSFSTEVGSPVTKKFLVTASNLSANVTVTTSGSGFSSSPAVILKSNSLLGTTGVEVTVTYNPSKAGTQTGTITVASDGAVSRTISLSGTATAASRYIEVSPSSLSFSTSAGAMVTKTFTVTGVNLNGDLELELDDGYGYFDITPTTITPAEAAAGVTVTVSYNPGVAGSHDASVYISGGGADSKTVSLSGTATAPQSAITVNPTSLSFSTDTDTPVTKTFTVTGTNLTGSLTLALTDAAGAYSISPTTLTAAQAQAGATVTVTYAPSAAGTHNGTVTVSGGGATSKTVSLSGTATEPVRTITVNPSTLMFNSLVGETATQTFIVTGENLNSNVTLALNDPNGVYTFTPATLTAAQAMAGATVTVTYTPTTYGNQSATITLSGGGANPVTVNLNGVATFVKYTPVMLPANETYVALTQFRADWTDETPEANVASYTLEVSPKEVAPVEPVLLHSLSGSAYTGNYSDITLPAPWSGLNVRGGNNAIYIKNNYNNVAQGYIKYTVPEGYNNATFTVMVTSANSTYGVGDVTVSSQQTDAVSHNFSRNQTYYWVVQASSGEQITITSTDNSYSPDMTLIAVYSGDASPATLMATETGDANSRLIEGITGKYYTVQNLAEAGTFLYRVKSIYIDGTESDWSNIEEVTLFENAHPYAKGDVNHDGFIDINDVTDMIAYVLNGGEDFCMICGDLTGDDVCDINDVTTLIGWVLNGVPTTTTMAMPLYEK